MYRWWPKKILDPPWTGWLGIAIQATSALIVTNATIVFILAVISSIAVDLSPNKADEKFIQGHIMLVRAELIFFYCTIVSILHITLSETVCDITTSISDTY